MRRNSIVHPAIVLAMGFAASIGAPMATAQPTIHLVVVADTLDPKIGKSVAVGRAHGREAAPVHQPAFSGALDPDGGRR